MAAAAATSKYFPTLGVAPAVGRTFGAEVERGNANVVVLSDGFWVRRFGGARDAIGKSLDLDGEPYTIVGVMPPSFRDVFSRQVEMWIPLVLTEAQYGAGYTNEYLNLVSRLAPGVGVDAARTEMTAFAERLKSDHPGEFMPDWTLRVTTLDELATKGVRKALLVLFGAVFAVLLIACANVASLLLTRASGQRRQVAVRQAMGASGWDTIRRLLVDGVVLGVAGALVGLALGWAGLGALEAVASRTVPGLADVSLDRNVLFFTLVVSVGTGVFVGLLPALGSWRADVFGALREGTRGDDRSGLRLRRFFVVAQLALSLALLVGAGLLLRSMARLQAISPGFEPEGVLTFFVALPPTSYPDGDAQRAFYDQLLPALVEVPGVDAVGVESVLPFSGGWSTSGFTIDGYQPGPNEPNPWGDIRFVSPGFQKALGLPLLEGRFFTEADGPETPQVAVVDEELARRYWPDGTAVGKRLFFNEDEPIEIIGVVGHAAHEGLDADPRVQVYGSYRQFPNGGMFVLARTSGDPNALLSGLRAAVAGLDPDLPLARVATMERLIAGSMGDRRLSLLLLAVFAGVALVLAATGVYGVMAQVVGQRTRELGVRIAMGAARGSVLRLVMWQGMGLVLVGTAVGVLGSLAVSRVLASQLFGVTATDPLTYALVVAVLLVSAAAATLVPALRATRVDPVEALRQE